MVTMRDVAEKAGVSVTSVSHVINQTRPVSEELRQRIQATMEELGYQPNALARSLRRKQTHSIGVIVPDSANPFFAEVARGIEATLFKQKYTVILGNSDGDLARELLYTNTLIEKQVDGIVFVAVGQSGLEHSQLVRNMRMPLMVVDRDVPGLSVDSVLTDNTLGGRLAAEHLLSLGHRRVGCITGPSDLTPSADRVTGCRQALAAANIPLPESHILKGDFQFQSGYEAARRMLSAAEPPTAIFACNDLMAVGAVSAAIERGLRVPQDISVVGYDDVPLASYTNPPLTTVAQPSYEMGQLAAEMLLQRISNREMPIRRMQLHPRLVVRQSTAEAGGK
ncbi:MAG: LacI family transcriptional regulator [Chloroflexi bacterium]|nr:MAG: LacI family transcriptional regulator [Chloroflexota bacterium]